MTEPTWPPAELVDTIARAIQVTDWEGDPGMAAWDDCLEDARESYRGLARAALAALPQPIGYGALIDGEIESSAWELADEPGALDYARARAAMADGTVVALVPIEVQS